MKLEYVRLKTEPTDWERILDAVRKCPKDYAVQIPRAEMKLNPRGLGGSLSRYSGRKVNVRVEGAFLQIVPVDGNVSVSGKPAKQQPAPGIDGFVTLKKFPGARKVAEMIKSVSGVKIPKRLFKTKGAKSSAIHAMRKKFNLKIEGSNRGSRRLFVTKPKGHNHEPLRQCPTHIRRANAARAAAKLSVPPIHEPAMQNGAMLMPA